MIRATYPFWLASKAVHANTDLVVRDKHTQEIASRVAQADDAHIDAAFAAAAAAAPAMAAMPACERRDALLACAAAFEARQDELAHVLCVEGGKPIVDARTEVARLVDTFRLAAGEATRIGGEVLPMDASPRAVGWHGFVRRAPIGACSFISPFNFPLNLAAHKVAPAIAAGCTFVLKPASSTPIGALLMGEVLAATNLPDGAFSILPCPREAADRFATDERAKLLSFTGSPDVGWDLKRRAGRKKVVLELGGNAAAVVEPDWDLEDAVARTVAGAFRQSGQSCIKAQRVYVHESRWDAFREQFVSAVRALRCGDPKDPAVSVGPLIAEKEAVRLEGWIASATRRGARVLVGGGRRGAVLEPTVLEGVPEDEPLHAEEAFGPVVVLIPYARYEDALAAVDRSRFGLQAGIFTRDWTKALLAWERLEVGGVIVGDSPNWRVDHMPYGGVKDSGQGREGVRDAILEMTEPRLLVLRRPPGR
jgi:acyl-CoA reductase-like NAD-dependent aldehyde dehydrogenase